MQDNSVYQKDNYSQELYIKLLGMQGADFSRLKEVLSISNTTRILSLACGNGVLEKKITNNFSNFIGVDNSEIMLNSFMNEIQQDKNHKPKLINLDIQDFLKQSSVKFNLCFANGFLPFYKDEKINIILNGIYNSLETEGLLSFYVERRTINWFEYEPKVEDNYNIEIFNFFKIVNKYRKEEHIEPYSKFYDSIYWDEKIKNNNLFQLKEKVEICWDNSDLTFNELIQIFTGSEKVLNLCIKVSEDKRELMKKELMGKFKDKLGEKAQLKMSRIFYVLKKNENAIYNLVSKAKVNFEEIQKNTKLLFNIDLLALTGVLRIEGGRYTPWGEIISSNEGSDFQESYSKLLDFRENKNHAKFATVLFNETDKKNIPKIVFNYKHGSINSIVSYDKNYDVIEINYDINNKFDIHFPFLSEKNLEVLIGEANKEYPNIIEKITNEFKKVGIDNLSITKDNLIGFFNVTSPIEKSVTKLIYLPYIPHKDFANGSLFLYIKGNDISNRILNKLSDYIYSYFSEYYLADFMSKLQKHAIKSAIAAIMARNMSHNLGSHILFYIKSRLLNAPKRYQKLLYELEKTGDDKYYLKVLNDYKDKIKIKIADQKEIKAPFLIGLGRFIGYLQERQDFIATIASNFMPYFDSVNFKDFIYDELLPDLKQKRDETDKQYETKNLFLDYIAKTEGYSSENIKIHFVYSDGKNASNVESTSSGGKEDSENTLKIQVDLPGGIIGRQAFFSIMENIIRNTAKHNEYSSELIFKIDIRKSKDYLDYYEVTVSDNISIYTEKKDILDIALEDKYVNDLGKPIKTNKGIKEMRISAAWLRGYNVADIDEQNVGEGEPKILQITSVNEKLGYKFYILQTKKVVLVIDKKEKINEDWVDKEQLEVCTLEEYINLKNKNYDIVLYDCDNKKFKDKIEPISVPRLYKVCVNEVKGLVGENKNIYEHYYHKWVEEKFFDNNEVNKYVDIVESKEESHYNDTIEDSNFVKYQKSLDAIKKGNKRAVIFSTHNDNKNTFKIFKRNIDLYEKCEFIEGISGHNSTVRLVRLQEKKGKNWAYKMIESAMTKVLIIDERLFDINNGNVNKQFNRHSFTSQDFENCTSISDFRSVIRNYKIDLSETIIRKINNIFGIEGNIFNGSIKILIKELNKDISTEKQENVTQQILEKKNIAIYNIEIKEGKAIVYDLKTKNISKITTDGDDESGFITLKSNDTYTYDFVVIHESILGKLYNLCKANVGYNKKETDLKKDAVFKSFKTIFPVNHKYIVHSGRSLPDYLPKETIFNQFSTIENALSDCKYTLTELLYSGRKN